MSYEIVYSRNFIKTKKGIIPLTLSGSNNCTEYTYRGRERREHNWTGLYFNVDFYEEAEIMNRIKSFMPSEYQQHFKLRGKWVDDKALIRFYQNGIKEAHTVEEWLSRGIAHNGKQKWRISSISACVCGWKRDKYERLNTLNATIKTEEELLNWTIQAKQYKQENEKEYDLYLHLDFGRDIDYISYEQEKKEKVISGKVVIKSNKKWYVSNDVRISVGDINEARVFENQQQAKDYIELENQKSYPTKNYSIVSYEQELKKINSKCFIIKFANGYFHRKTRYGFNYCYSLSGATKMEEKKAKEYIEDFKKWYPGYTWELVKVGA